MFIKAFWLAFSLVFLAELGDRTQVLVLTLSTKYRALVVFAGAVIGILLLHLLAVVLGKAAGRTLPLFWINLIGGTSFIMFGLWALRSGAETDEHKLAETQFGAFLTVVITFVIAELGDKSTLLTLTVASQERSFIGVWLGSSAGMAVSDGLAIIVGSVFGKRLPEKLIKYGSAAVFIVLGGYRVIEAFRH
jgi:putative Ca2+/H+ antiporter (TMEM165/GDT1 family)